MAKTIAGAFVIVFFLSLISSCNQAKSKEEKIIGFLEKSLVTSNQVISLSIEGAMKNMEDKSYEFRSREKAQVWFPIAKQIIWRTKLLYDFLESNKHLREKYISSCNSIIDSLRQFKEDLLRIDPVMKEVFSDRFEFIESYISVSGCNSQVNTIVYQRLGDHYSEALLTSLQNEIKKLSNAMVQYCDLVSTPSYCGFDSQVPLLCQNSNYLEPGKTLEIKAGVGAFSKSAQPKIIINGRYIPLNEEGFSHYKIKVPKSSGNYKIPVVISYLNYLTGKDDTLAYSIEYTVADTCRL